MGAAQLLRKPIHASASTAPAEMAIQCLQLGAQQLVLEEAWLRCARAWDALSGVGESAFFDRFLLVQN